MRRLKFARFAFSFVTFLLFADGIRNNPFYLVTLLSFLGIFLTGEGEYIRRQKSASVVFSWSLVALLQNLGVFQMISGFLRHC